jgi:hypothetical protein
VVPPPNNFAQMQSLTNQYGPLSIVRTYTEKKPGLPDQSYTVYQRTNGDLITVGNQSGIVVWNVHAPNTLYLTPGPRPPIPESQQRAEYIWYIRQKHGWMTAIFMPGGLHEDMLVVGGGAAAGVGYVGRARGWFRPAQQQQQQQQQQSGPPVLTPWGWTNSTSWRAAVRQVEAGGELPTVMGRVPTYAEAVALIAAAGGTIQRVEGPHSPNGVAARIDFNHINYTTASGRKSHLGIQSVPPSQ